MITGALVLAGGALALIGLVGTEVVLAGRGLILTEYDPGLADGRIQPAGSGDPSDPPLRVTWIGDSTAAGVGSSGADGSVSRQVGQRLADELDRPIDVQVVAVSGARVADVVASQVDLVDPEADVVIISVGANDTTHVTSTGTFATDYATMLAALPDDATVVALGVPDLGSVTRLAQPLRSIAAWRGGSYDAIVRDASAAAGAIYVDIAGGTGPSFRADPDGLLAADHYHPSDDGYAVWTDVIVPSVVGPIRARMDP